MATLVSKQKLLWHLTPLKNLEDILKSGLLARNHVKKFVDIADQEIISKRDELGLSVYVPFHFFQGNPFDGDVIKSNQDMKFCFIVIKRELAKLRNYKILPKHPLSLDDLELFDYDQGIAVMDWDLINKREYHDQACKTACMAECLVPGKVSPSDFFSITVKTDEDKTYVEHLSNSILKSYTYYIDVKSYCFPE